MSVHKKDYLSRLQTLLVFLILNCMAKTNFTILCCGEIVGPFKDKMTLLSIVVAEDTCIPLYLVMILSFLSAFGNKRSCMHMP